MAGDGRRRPLGEQTMTEPQEPFIPEGSKPRLVVSNDRRLDRAPTETMIDRVDFAMSQVIIVGTTAGSDDGTVRWAVWDQNQDTDEIGPTIVFLGAPYDPEKDSLEKPPGPVYWAHRDAVARAAIAAIREPDEVQKMIARQYFGLNPFDKDGPPLDHLWLSAWQAMIDAILAQEPKGS